MASKAIQERKSLMLITVNGKPIEVSDQITVKLLLDEARVEMQEYVSVQLNGELLARDDFSEIPVPEGAEVEFLYYMGGGGSSC
jgi:sulfur carrier protein